MSAEPGRPPLSMRFNDRVWTRVDVALAAICALIIYGVMYKGSRGIEALPLQIWLAGAWVPPLLSIIVAFPVAVRRHDPIGAHILALVGCSLVIAAGGEVTRGPFLPLALTLFMVAATRTRMVAVCALAASLALIVIQGFILSLSGFGSGPATGIALILIIAWMIGITVQQRRSYTARVREQVATAAVTEERLRIARELHDVVAHSMTVVAVQAGFGEYVFDADPDQARAALGNIQHVTSEALSDMQRLLGVLRQDAAGQPGTVPAADRRADGQAASPPRRLQLAPAPGLADLERLVSTTAGAGVRVDLTRTGERRDIPAAIGQSAFRIVQEALTNVVKHSGAGFCTVTIGYERTALTVEITDPGGAGAAAQPPAAARADGTGHGILGMRERVSLSGGEFTAGPLPGRGFRVRARFPLPAPQAARRADAEEPERTAPAAAAPAVTPAAVRALPGQAR